MKYKIKLFEIDESVEDVEFHVNFMFVNSQVMYRAELMDMNSKALFSFLNKEVMADLTLELPNCKQNKENRNTWLSHKRSFDLLNNIWISPEEIRESKKLSPRYLCSGKIADIVLDEFEYEYYRLQSEHIIDVFTGVNCYEQDDIKREDIKIGEYYSFDGILTIKSIDEIEALYKNKD